MKKSGEIAQQNIILVIIIALVFVLFITGIAQRGDARGVKQEVLEKQIALFIDSAESGINLSLRRQNINGHIDDIRVKDGRVYVSVEGLSSAFGYPYFSSFRVRVYDRPDGFTLEVLDE
jgi:hypothetical protein